MRRLMVLVLLAGMLGLLYGCGGGGESDTPLGGDGNPDGGSGDGVNGELRGRVFLDNYGMYVLDLATGERTKYAAVGYNATRRKRAALPTRNGDEVVHIDYSGATAERVIIRDADGRTLTSFSVSKTLFSDVKLSPDHQTVAAFWSNDDVNGSDAPLEFTLFSRDGSRWQQPFTDRPIHSFDWLSDGSLVYAADHSIYVSNPGWDQSTQVVALESPPNGLAASTDGRQIAFRLLNPEATSDNWDIWMVNRDGSGLRQVTDTSSTFAGVGEHNPVWSPDGRWLLVPSGPHPPRPAGSGSRTICEFLYAIPADATRLVVSEDPSYDKRGPARKIWHYAPYTGTDGALTTYSCALTSLMWLPPVVDGEESGSLPRETSSANRGLTGTLYYRLKTDDGRRFESWALNLSSGIRSRLPDAIRGTAASADGQEFAYVTNEANVDTVAIINRDGDEAARFSRSHALSGPVRFSPDGSLLAFTADETVNAGETMNNESVAVATRDGVSKALFPDFTTYDWLSDGDLVLGGADGLYRGNIQSGMTTRLFPLADKVLDLTVSPDGQHLTFRMVGRLWVSALDGQDLRRLTESEDFEFLPEWSPDGRYIVFKHIYDTRTNPTTGLWVVAADARGVRIGDPERHRNGIAVRQKKDDGRLELVMDAYSYPSWR